MSFEKTKEFWDQQAEKYATSPQATTNDYYMREIEIRNLRDRIASVSELVSSVADIGCGNGFSTLELAKAFPDIQFTGCDYSAGMIESANASLKESGLSNVSFHVLDLTADEVEGKYDFIYTDRCLINLPTWESQKTGLEKICRALNDGGTYIMIENFLDGQSNFNSVRKAFDLPEISIRDHNLFFNKEDLLQFVQDKLEVVEYSNISSLYYLVSRVVYSKICAEENAAPDYYDVHHKLGSMLPEMGNYGPISLYHFKKK